MQGHQQMGASEKEQWRWVIKWHRRGLDKEPATSAGVSASQTTSRTTYSTAAPSQATETTEAAAVFEHVSLQVAFLS